MSWSWTLLSWGALIGATGVLGSYLIGRRAQIETNRWPAYRGFVAASAGFAVLAAALDSAWPLLGFASYVLVVNFIVPVALLTRVRTSSKHRCSTATASCSAEACAACPLSSASLT